jgi:protein-serine/threonine kinase
MQTSCGSPCYAAPELVISEGLYVGSAVDIWSCGVILYAMLAGYLPFDDDPANPEGDNINLLYKYILSTQLTFPDYVSVEARDLLSKMLVPDPQFRADLQTVMSHEWLSPYASLFGRSIEEYESVAQEQQMQKRANYQRQIREREREVQRAIKAQQREQQRQHAHTEPRPIKSTSGYAGQVPMEVEDPNMYTPVSNRRAVASAIIMPTSTGPMEDLVMTGPASVEPQRNGDERARKESRASERRSGKGKEVDHREKKGAGPSSKGGRPPPGGFRHTIQLEYDDGGEQAEAMPPTPSKATGKRRHDEEDVVMQSAESPSRSRRESSGPRPSQAAPPVPPMPGPLPMQVSQLQASPSPTRTTGPSTLHTLVRNAATEPTLSTYKPASDSRTSLPTPPADIVINTGVPVPASAPLQSPVASSPVASTMSTPSSSGNKPSKHGRGMSIDRFSISKLLHGKDSSGEEKKEKEESKKRPSRKGSETSSNAGAGMAGIGAGGGIPTPPTSAALTSTSNLSVASGCATATSTLGQTSVGKGTSKRRGGKALSLVVDPITRHVASML